MPLDAAGQGFVDTSVARRLQRTQPEYEATRQKNEGDESVVPAGSLIEARDIAMRRNDRDAGIIGTIRRWFLKFSHATSDAVGSPWAFIVAVLIVIFWAVSGPVFHFSDTWQLVINTGTTIVTFLMVFLIQNTQNRDAKAIHLKLDELIRSKKGARNAMVDLENLSSEELDRIDAEFKRLRKRTSKLPEEDDTPKQRA